MFSMSQSKYSVRPKLDTVQLGASFRAKKYQHYPLATGCRVVGRTRSTDMTTTNDDDNGDDGPLKVREYSSTR